MIITVRHFVFAKHCAALQGPKTLLQSVAGLTGCSLLLKSWHSTMKYRCLGTLLVYHAGRSHTWITGEMGRSSHLSFHQHRGLGKPRTADIPASASTGNGWRRQGLSQPSCVLLSL